MSTPTEYTISACACTGDPAVVDTGTTALGTHLMAFEYDGAEVDVVARRQDGPPTVYNTLVAVCDVHRDLLAVPTATVHQGDRR